MEQHSVQVRAAVDADARALTEIHNHYVRESCITLDEEPQSIEQRTAWMKNYASTGRYRLLVAEAEGEVLGCAFSSEYRQHAAFRETVETSIYLHAAARGTATGSARSGWKRPWTVYGDQPSSVEELGMLPLDVKLSVLAVLDACRSVEQRVREEVMLDLGAHEVYLGIAGPRTDAPLVLHLHGGPGNVVAGLLPFQANVGQHLEQNLLVACLHQRGARKSPPVPMSEQTVSGHTFAAICGRNLK